MIKLHVKSYVYRYLMLNFNVNVPGYDNAVSFAGNFQLSSMLRVLLQKEDHSEDYRAVEQKAHHNKTVYICIGENAFIRKGSTLTPTGENMLNEVLQDIVQQDFLSYAAFMYMVEPRVASLIERYKSRFGYSEEDWPSDSMQKICTRKRLSKLRSDCRGYFLDKIEDFFMTQLSNSLDSKRLKKEVSNVTSC